MYDKITPVGNIFSMFSKPSVPFQKYEDNLYNGDKTVLEYMVRVRKLKLSTLQYFHVGATENKEVAIPVFKDGVLIDYKFRNVVEKSFRRHPESETWALNDIAFSNCVKDGYLIAVEGEIDCMSLWQLGFKNVVSTTGGAQSKTPWVSRVPDNVKIYIAYDQDEPGQDAAQELAERIGLERCYNVKLPGKDSNEFLVNGGTTEEFQELMDESGKFRVQDIFKIDEVLDRLENNKLKRETTFSRRLTNELGGGIPQSSLVTISGRTGVGKSTALMNMLVHHANKGKPVLLISLENDLYFTIQRLLEIKYGKKYKEFTKKEWTSIKKDMVDYPFYIDVSMDSYTVPKIQKIVKQTKSLFGIEFLGFDHIGFIPLRNETREISTMVRDFKLLARSMGIIVYMISHVRRSQNVNDSVSSEDLKGSSSIAQDSDVVLLVIDTKVGMEIIIDKARMSKSKLRVPLSFDGETGVMKDDTSRSIHHYDEEVPDAPDAVDGPITDILAY